MGLEKMQTEKWRRNQDNLVVNDREKLGKASKTLEQVGLENRALYFSCEDH